MLIKKVSNFKLTSMIFNCCSISNRKSLFSSIKDAILFEESFMIVQFTIRAYEYKNDLKLVTESGDTKAFH